MVRRRYQRRARSRRPRTYNRASVMPIPGSSGVDYCIKYFRTVGNVTVNASNDISFLQEFNTMLSNNNSYLTYRSLYRKGKILGGSITFMPGFQLTNNATSPNNMQPICLTPLYGDVIAGLLSYTSLVGNPATRFMNPYDPKARTIKWKAPSDPPLDWYDTNGVNLLSDTVGGFAIYGDGTGFASNTIIGSVVITCKVAFKESTVG